MTFWESGAAEDDYGGYGYGRRRRYWEDDDEDENDDEGEHTMGEVFDTSLTLDHLSDRDGKGLPVGELSVDSGTTSSTPRRSPRSRPRKTTRATRATRG